MKKTVLKSMLVAGMLTLGLGAQAQTDVTDQYVMNADLSTDPATEGNGWTLLNGWRQDYKQAEDAEHVNVVEFYAGWGSLEKTEYAMTQTITLPAGNYRLAVNAFYREGNDGNGKNEDKAYIFAGEKTQNVYAIANFYGICSEKGYVGSSDLWKASNGFFKGDFSNAFDFTMESDGDIEIGFQGIFDQARSWVILGPVKLYQYTVADYIEDYKAKVAEAQPLLDEIMSSSAKEALKAAIVDESTLTTVEQVTAAIANLNEAIMAAQNSIALYISIKAALDKIQAIDPDLNMAVMWDDYENGLFETLEEVDQYYAVFQQLEIQKLGTADNTDYTLVIINPSFEWGNTFGWTYEPSSDHGAKPNSNETYTVQNADGDYVFNIWWSGNAITQTIEGLPNGKYSMNALIASDAGNQVNLLANDYVATFEASEEGKGVGIRCEVEFEVTDGIATIGAEANVKYDDEGNESKPWYKVDDFHLTLISATTTGITSVAAEQKSNTIYNLAGQQVRQAQKGLYIVNGKKVIK